MGKLGLRKGFTLLEILTVISIIGILAAIFVPIAGRAMDRARKSNESNNLRQIVLGYYHFLSSEDYRGSMEGEGVHDFAGLMADKMDLNDPQVWMVKEDPLVEGYRGKVPNCIGYMVGESGRWEVSQEFRKCPLSIRVVKGISINGKAATTPVAWTRGLLANGRWASFMDKEPGVYGDRGGFIGFLDGHVKWYKDLGENGGLLVNYVTGKPTCNIYEAIPPHASVLD